MITIMLSVNNTIVMNLVVSNSTVTIKGIAENQNQSIQSRFEKNFFVQRFFNWKTIFGSNLFRRKQSLETISNQLKGRVTKVVTWHKIVFQSDLM